MIGIIGHMSGGKTYFAVEQILKFLFYGHPVVTNIRLQCRYVSDYLGIPCIQWKQLYFYLCDKPSKYHELQISSYESYPTGSPRGSSDYDLRLCYIVLDEVSSIFDSMIHASDSNIQKVATWARHTRKRGQELLLVMQFASELHKRLRVHITEYISCNNSNNLRIPLLGTGLPWFMRNMSVRQRFLSDLETPIGVSEWFVFRPEVYRCYNTAQIVVGQNNSIRPLVVDVDKSLFLYRLHKRLFYVASFISILLLCIGLVVYYVRF